MRETTAITAPTGARHDVTSAPGILTRPSARLAWLTSVGLCLLMTAQALAGLLAPAVYRDPEWVRAAWFGNDLVTLCVAVPILLWSLIAVRGGSRRAELVWYAMLGYAVYNAGYYLFGASLNVLFPLLVVLFVLPIVGLVLALGSADVGSVAASFAPSAPVRLVAGYMLLTGIGLSVAWLAQWAAYVLGGTVPPIGVDAFALVAAMDLSFVVPWFLIGAVLLLRRRPWGFVIAPIMLIKGATYTLVLTAGSSVAASRGIEGTGEQIPIWAAWTVVGALVAWALLRSANR